jgi:hypothetical protein
MAVGGRVAVPDRSPSMKLPGTVADVFSGHVTFEVECIDRMYLNVWQPRLAYGGGVAGFSPVTAATPAPRPR